MGILKLASFLVTASMAMAQAATLTTTMVGGLVLTGYVGSNTLYFDVTVLNPAGVTFTRFDLRTQLGPAGPADVYVTAPGVSQSANRTNPLAWTLVGSASVTAAGTSQAILAQPFVLAPGTYGMAIHMSVLQAVYTNPATPVPPLPTIFSNADLSINCVDARIQNSTPAAPFSGGISNVRTPNVICYYTTATRVVNFTATPTTGSSPLLVNFTASAVSTNPGGILAYSWDFDGDSVPDSNLQNPSFTYTLCGIYNVTLTVFDALGQDSITKTGFVVVDPLTARFTFANTALPNVIQFTDTSTLAPQTFAWDLDGDGVADSTAQNPIWPYAGSCAPTQVRLTVTNSCNTSTVTQAVASRPTAMTLFNANNGGVVGAGNYFDVNVTNPNGISICGIYSSCNVDPAGVAATAQVYVTPNTYVGNDLNAAVWTLVGSGSGLTAPFNSPTYFQFASNVYLAPGSYGVAVHLGLVGPAYSGTGTSPAPGSTTYSNADLTYTLGLSHTTPFGGTVFTPRIWNGGLVYETVATGLAVYRKIGNGCAGTLGVVTNVATTLPRVGTTLSVTVGNLLANAGFFVLGLSDTFGSLGPLPVDLGVLGAPGCVSYVSADSVSLLLGATNTATFSFQLPNRPSYLGIRFFTQSVGLDIVNPLGLVMGDAAAAVVGF